MISFILISILMILTTVIITSFFSIKMDRHLKITTLIKTQVLNEFIPLYLSILFLGLVSIIVSTVNKFEYLIIINFLFIQMYELLNDDRKTNQFEMEMLKTISVVITYIMINREITQGSYQIASVLLLLPMFVSMDKNKIIQRISSGIIDLSLLIYFFNKLYVVSTILESVLLTLIVCALYAVLKVVWREMFYHIQTRVYWSCGIVGVGIISYVA